jgi:hypothetical protein
MWLIAQAWKPTNTFITLFPLRLRRQVRRLAFSRRLVDSSPTVHQGFHPQDMRPQDVK